MIQVVFQIKFKVRPRTKNNQKIILAPLVASPPEKVVSQKEVTQPGSTWLPIQLIRMQNPKGLALVLYKLDSRKYKIP